MRVFSQIDNCQQKTKNKKQNKKRGGGAPLLGLAKFIYYIPNQWIVFFACSDWLLKLGMESAIHLPAFFCIPRTSFFLFSQKRNDLLLAIHWFGIH